MNKRVGRFTVSDFKKLSVARHWPQQWWFSDRCIHVKEGESGNKIPLAISCFPLRTPWLTGKQSIPPQMMLEPLDRHI